jgi:CTP:molybdopterin cytidylyltransferase MocA
MIAAVVPAAGKSKRMGRPKLTLPIDGEPLIARVVSALRLGGVEQVVVVAPPADAPGAHALAVEAERAGAIVIVADQPPPDMRASVELGLASWKDGAPPATLLLTPGDSPGLSPALVARVVARSRAEPRAIVVPAFRGRRGHPVALPWPLAEGITRLPPGTGINTLVRDHQDRVVVIDVDDAAVTADLDTPEDYQRWVASSADEPNRP